MNERGWIDSALSRGHGSSIKCFSGAAIIRNVVRKKENMKISKRGEYALRALIDLGIASELGWPMLQISELASKEKLPIKFLEQISRN